MAYLVQVDFPHEGPFGDEMATAFTDLAKNIAQEKGFIWKLWTENEETKESGGIYLFDTKEDAENYMEKNRKNFDEFGIKGASMKLFKVNEQLSQITQGPLK
ncbi:monooxygenase [Oceanobacillus piezotolerans]|uniref:Monooxygenase n=1 Tax=Oceanobacillus piezotolerans TaxID=2448030 RepID=A0A498DAV5_9BACI|nr:monooxygenase [Oceanobacillus piezotolerans]RLL46718.1 monooxygenase [Oceanobacillus piezotolerans]